DVDPDLAVERLVEHRGFTAEDARARMQRQVGREERLAKADHVIDNSGDLEDLDHQVEEAWAWIESLRD
ncbi:MAG: dephospho-CoA kinase, partial [Actinomycetota bacterium]